MKILEIWKRERQPREPIYGRCSKWKRPEGEYDVIRQSNRDGSGLCTTKLNWQKKTSATEPSWVQLKHQIMIVI
jgi:hypothetical protein